MDDDPGRVDDESRPGGQERGRGVLHRGGERVLPDLGRVEPPPQRGQRARAGDPRRGPPRGGATARGTGRVEEARRPPGSPGAASPPGPFASIAFARSEPYAFRREALRPWIIEGAGRFPVTVETRRGPRTPRSGAPAAQDPVRHVLRGRDPEAAGRAAGGDRAPDQAVLADAPSGSTRRGSTSTRSSASSTASPSCGRR